MYPWAKLDIHREVSMFTCIKKNLKIASCYLCESYPVKKKDVILVPYKPEEPMCKDCINELHFCFFYETLFTKLGV